jgi:Flp pilus assembly protein TadG
LAGFFRGPESDSGVTLVEFAIGLPVLFGLVFGIMELGRFGFTHASLYHAAQETTRWAIVNPIDFANGETQAQYEARLSTEANRNLILISAGNMATVTASAPESGLNDKTRNISVAINYQYDPMMPFVFWGTINLSVASQAFIAEEDGEGFVSATEESCNVAHENCGGQ